jgi:hypothetical protein
VDRSAARRPRSGRGGLRELYSDPVTVNGISLTATDLVARPRVMHEALERPEREVLSVLDAGTSVAVAFRPAGRRVGPLDTSAGRVTRRGGGWTFRSSTS